MPSPTSFILFFFVKVYSYLIIISSYLSWLDDQERFFMFIEKYEGNKVQRRRN